MHAFPKGVMCKPESAEFDATIQCPTKSIAKCPTTDGCTTETQFNLRSDHRALIREAVSGNSYRLGQTVFNGFDNILHSSNDHFHSSNNQHSPDHVLTSRTSSLANASKEQPGSSFTMSHSPVHSSVALDWAATCAMKRHTEPARPNRTSRFGQPVGCEPNAIRTRLPLGQSAAHSHPHPFSSYLLHSSRSPCNSHPAVDSASPTKLSHTTSSSHSAKLSPCSPKATKPNSATISPKMSRHAAPITSFLIILFCLLQLLANGVQAASTAFDFQNNQADNSIVYQDSGSVSDLHIECNSNSIVLVLNTQNEQFNGLIYPKGLSKNSSCMVEYNNQIANNITYLLPLRSCNTMSTDLDDGVEYFNTIVVQPHRRLVTNQGKGYHIRCRYQTREKSITNFFNVTTIGNVPVTASAPIPLCSMKIFQEDTDTEIFIAENVKIGDKLKLEIKIEEQPVYGMKVTNCLVRDGLNWAEQVLLNDDGCPIDEEILGQFKYNKNLTRAMVSFQAHKFPYTSSVYYQCNVRLCLKQAGGCTDTPPNCDKNAHSFRKRRDLNKPGIAAALRTDEIKELSLEVYSGLHVNEADSEEESDLLPPKKIVSEQEFCISMRKFAIGVSIASMLLMTAVVLLVACILQRRRRRKHISTTCSSIYSGPYSNRGFSRD